ncbi:hypothetical protein XaplCFBP3122_16545 [Xanthomonas arboricola pv. populi]|uniref:Uncharacterized protein n=1 Tax=Xanthomonas arboricola pv. populi TaxID=487823 RepID=A0A2S6Z1P2_9XANT|nr:hypothetical protein XaplCFBP3122_16545 [Xanthomonas arboricola pv. populi]
MSTAMLSRSTTTCVRAWHPRSAPHTRSVTPALHGAHTHCARRTATRRRSAKNGGETRSLNSR